MKPKSKRKMKPDRELLKAHERREDRLYEKLEKENKKFEKKVK